MNESRLPALVSASWPADPQLTSQLALLRVLHSQARPLLAAFREKLMSEQLEYERLKLPPSLTVAASLKQIDEWNEHAEKVEQVQGAW